MVAEQIPDDDPITALIQHGIALRSQSEPRPAAWIETLAWGAEHGYFDPATGVLDAPTLVAILVTGLETLATRWRHQQREQTVQESLRLLHRPLPPEPTETPHAAPPPPAPLPTQALPPPVPPAPPQRHLLDGYAMAKYRRDLTLGSMTLNDWETIQVRLHASTLGQARFEAQVTLVVKLAVARGVQPSQPFREVLTNEEAAQALALADEVRDEVGANLDQRIAHIVATNALFGN